MKSWTLIPFYLWKNTFRRWLEYPVSPFSKILIPTLLGFLAIGVLTMFAEIERELRDQLAKNSVYSVSVSEFVPKDLAPVILGRTFEEEIIWSEQYGSNVIMQVRQPFVSVIVGGERNVPLLAFSSSLSELQETEDIELPPAIFLLSDDPVYQGQSVGIALGGKRGVADVKPVPQWIRRGLAMDTVALIPIEMIEGQLANGFINHMTAESQKH